MTSSSAPVRLAVLLQLAWPVVLSRSTQAVMGFFDALMTAPLGQSALAASTTGAINVFALAILPTGVVFMVQSFAAQLSGAGDLVGARRYGWYGLILSGVAGLVALVGLPLVDPVLGLFEYEPAVHELMSAYLVIRLTSIGAMLGMEAIGNWFGGHGNTRQQMVASVLAMVVDIALNWILIYGMLGFPAMGVAGAALGSSIASFVGLAYLMVVFVRRSGVPHPERPSAPGAARLRWNEMVRMVRFGVPNGLNWFLEFAAFVLFINVVMADLGTAALAAFMVVLNINSVSFMPAFGLSSAGAILVGQAIGAGRVDQVPGILRLTAMTAAAWQGTVGLVYLLFPAALMSWFAPPGESGSLLAVGATLLAISAAWQLFDAIGITVGEALRAAGDTTWCLYARVMLAWLVFTPVSVVVVMVMDGGHVEAILCVVGYIAILAGLLVWRFRSGRWREIDLTGTRDQPLVA
jgi:MATE family multidrug resistance protein